MHLLKALVTRLLFRNHLIVTAAVAVVTISNIELVISSWWVVALIVFGSLLPDLDHPKSTIGKRVLFISLPLSALIGHRKLTHSIWPIIGFYYLFNTENDIISAVVFSLSIGYISHLLADFFTDSGIPFFWPFPLRIKSPIPVETGGVFEYVIAYSLLLSSIIYG